MESLPDGERNAWLDRLRTALPERIAGAPRQEQTTWNGERLFVNFSWAEEGAEGSDEKPVAAGIVRLQWIPLSQLVWFGHLEVRPDLRGRGLGSCLVWAVEEAARLGGVIRIRLFARFQARDFWKRLHYESEGGSRWFRKRVSPTPPSAAPAA